MKDPRVSLVTVVYAAELPLLRLQARSLSLYFQNIDIDRIVVCVNDRNEEDTMEKVEALRSEYGNLSDHLSVLGGDDVFSPPTASRNFHYMLRRMFAVHFHRIFRPQGGWKRNNGWNMQQAFKLAAARHCDSDYVILLDAKNIFIRAVELRDFLDGAGRPRARFSKTNKLNARWYAPSARILGQHVKSLPPEYTAFVTPFCLKRHWACEILEILERRNLPVEFVFSRPRNRATEFMILNAFINMKGVSARDFFAEGLLRSYTVFAGMADALAERILAEAFEESAKCIGIHSRFLIALDNRTSRLACQHLVSGQLASSMEDARSLLSGEEMPSRDDGTGGG